ncbi:hypothetical protein TSAR_002910 [Trichomalopsis sarcophagae]|uniref:Uncharacterized protein n=1 Tax=Trichomalopsis sarcophagae TaxID=543379 RepID=A0A232ESR7_9HYME|nr:hypothetical protein TSAR_002910 [Trichomalopsis sarcophagae]
MVIIILTKYTLRLFQSNNEFACSYNIAMIVFRLNRLSTPVQSQKLREKIIYASLLIISVVFSAELLKYIINISINKKQYYVFNTFQNVNDSGIYLTMENNIYSIVYDMLNRIGALAYINITVIPYKQECVNMITEDDTVNACLSDNIMMNEIIQKYSKPHSGWIISEVKSGLFPMLVPRFFLENKSPYANKFSTIIQRLVEFGIPIFWLECRLQMFALENNDTTALVSSGSKLAYRNIEENQTIDNVEQPLIIRLIYVLVEHNMLEYLCDIQLMYNAIYNADNTITKRDITSIFVNNPKNHGYMRISNWHSVVPKVHSTLQMTYSNIVHIMFLDTCISFDNHRLALKSYLKFLSGDTEFRGFRPIILIFFINRNNIFNIRLFLKEMWSKLHYLYITIIEVNSQASCNKHLNTSMYKTQMAIFVHQYNPFNDSHEVVDLFENRKLFDEKLRNMHGYILRASHSKTHYSFLPIEGYYEEENVKRNYFSQAFSDTEYMLMKTIAQTLNFSINTILISQETHPSEVSDALSKSTLDFSTNSVQSTSLMGVPGISYLHETTHLIIKQYGYYDVIVPRNLILATTALLVTIILTKFTLRLFQSNREFASSYNIAMIVFGLSTPVEPQKLREKIIYASLLIISVVFSAELLEYIINLTINQKQYYVFNTLQDVNDSGIYLTMEDDTYTIIQQTLRTIGALDYTNITVIPYKQKCVNMMTEDDTVNACVSDSIVMYEIIQNYSKPQNGWIISEVKANLFSIPTPRFLFENKSPYANKFSTIIQRLVSKMGSKANELWRRVYEFCARRSGGQRVKVSNRQVLTPEEIDKYQN